MDIFGTVVSAADLAVKVVGYIQAVKGAKEDRRRLLPEISALGALLQVLRGRLGDSTTNGAGGSFSSRLVMAGIEAPLRECEGALRDTVTRLERLVLDVNTGKSFSFTERMRDIRWPFRQEEIGTMLDRIERLKSLVSLAFQTSLMEFVEKAHDELAAVGLNVTGIESAVSAIEADQRAHAEKTESLYVDLQALGWTLRDSANSIAKIESTIAIMNRNQQDQLMKESLIQADLAIIKEGRELQEVLKWLSPLDFNGKHNAAFEKHAPGTGEWFLGHPKFLAWQQGEYKVLWCPGGPGVGKSALVRRLQERTSENMAVVYIYFDYTIKYAVAQLLEALLSQLMRRRTTRSGMESLRSYMAGNRRPTLDELINILKAEAETYTRDTSAGYLEPAFLPHPGTRARLDLNYSQINSLTSWPTRKIYGNTLESAFRVALGLSNDYWRRICRFTKRLSPESWIRRLGCFYWPDCI
ncbi:hypothetical protein BD779DRAFT_636217 [Infundibulicybe gibba]|nr:hypothetical protein BD779DRAFT_636217 [Infundibulicybe gibba]